ncbi:DNA primase family protein [Clostridium faecium]|uniref:DNA primase family protein n=1 Tax=Clostridium faecium TaxID=2762223 RepID=UPI0028BDE16E|nr:phage/plasmid primase, P4 family [Clostridium faecium]
MDEGKRLSESLVKQLTGGDKISTRFLFGRDFEYEPSYKVWISTNHKPKIYGNDNGIWRRICLIPFEVTIADDKKDINLDRKLANEIGGIFNWALEGLMEWKKYGLKPPAKVCAATMEYRMQEDLLQGFIDNCVEISKGNRISATDLYKFYEWYCEQNGISKLSSTKFGTKFREDKGFQKKQICGRVYYVDIKIKKEIKESFEKDTLLIF